MEPKKDQECCPRVNPALWENQEFNWENKHFIKDQVCTFLFMPLNFGAVMKRMMERVEKAGGEVSDYLCLSDHTSRWNMDLYLAVDKEIPGAENVSLSGKYLSKVYEGSFKNTDKWCEDFAVYVKGKGLTTKKMYMWYTTCPKCAKKYGKNYVVIIAEVS
ncbi:MAG TPA: hypothetical protein PKI61_04025 [bacterium]|nr:hypothetical protein [bacterium]HPT29825.1 hypothetical protein [bacterium]